ncbi:MAG TPA: homoserine dehydrogenase [Candidatus Hydrogenedentes bacterium]|nr:homoserine dehydrogenase [Candidatus Hydrogenedentota bacterium]
MGIGVGVIGAGTVGGGVIEILSANTGVIADKTGAQVALRHVAELKQELLQDCDLEGVTVSADANALIHDPQVHVVCELIGGLEPAKTFILEALNAKKHVVTANKMLLAKHGAELAEAAARNGVGLRYEAAVAGAIPIIKALREGLAANHIHAVYGILNGTCNYILSRMTYEGLEFQETLDQAIANGFAETPPDLDIEGHDTAHKCQILASLAYSTKVSLDAIPVEGITNITHLDVAYAREMGCVIKLLAVVRKVEGEIEARVHPTLVPETHLLAAVRNEFNAVYVESDCADATLYYGRGAGRLPTASAVVADIVDIARRGEAPALPPFSYTHALEVRDIGLLEGRYYLCLTTEDHPGVLGKVCTILGKHGVSIASCIQKNRGEGEPVHVILMTHTSIESGVIAALAEIDRLDFITEATHLLRVL